MEKAKNIFCNNKLIGVMFLMIVATLFLLSCSPKVQKIYRGSRLPSNEVDILTSFQPIRILEIDGKHGHANINFGFSSKWNGKCAVELEPGIHEINFKTIEIKCKGLYSKSNNLVAETKYTINKPKKLSFTFDSGKIYKIISPAEIIEIKQFPASWSPHKSKNIAYNYINDNPAQ